MRSISQDTLSLVRQSRQERDDLRKVFTTATGLINFDLERPAKSLYPVLTPLLNITPRVKGSGDKATHWRAIRSIDDNFINPGTTEGIRNETLTETVKDFIATYKTLGVENSVTFEAELAAEAFDDAKARAVESLLRTLLITEENVLLGGNTSVALGTGPTPTVVDNGASTGGSIPTATTVHVRILPLTHEGFRVPGSLAKGVFGKRSRTTADGTAETFGGYSGQIGASASVLTGAGANHSLNVSWTSVAGAFAYALFWGPDSGANCQLGAIVTINSFVVLTAQGAGGASLSTGAVKFANDANIATDNSKNSLIYDGLLYLGVGAGQGDPPDPTSGAFITTLGTGTIGVGTPLTSDGQGGITEINDILRRMWDERRLSPDIMVVNAQEYNNITKKVIGGGGAPLFRFVLDRSGGPVTTETSVHITAGTVVATYFNKFTLDGGQMVKVMLHPNIAPGTVLFLSTRLPYPTTNVGNVWQIKARREYYQIDWPIRNRKYEYGIYVDEVLQHYATFSMGILTNIGDG